MRDAGRNRISARKRGYDSRWDKARRLFLTQNPLCRVCDQSGRVTAAAEVDHVIPHRGDMTLFWDEANWQPICRPCHEAKSASEQSGKPEIGVDGWPLGL